MNYLYTVKLDIEKYRYSISRIVTDKNNIEDMTMIISSKSVRLYHFKNLVATFKPKSKEKLKSLIEEFTKSTDKLYTDSSELPRCNEQKQILKPSIIVNKSKTISISVITDMILSYYFDNNTKSIQ